MATLRPWLRTKHHVYAAWEHIWRTEERRLRGGHHVLDELVRFDWEEPQSVLQGSEREASMPAGEREVAAIGEEIANKLRRVSYAARQAQATYINFPDMHASLVTGHLLREAPSPGSGLDFGTLGQVDSPGTSPSYASLVYGNVDGLGNEGSQWDPWWLAAAKRSMATGHRWIMTEAPGTAPLTDADVLAGLRPYLVELSPLSVPQWHMANGRLEMAIVKTAHRVLEVDDKGNLKGDGKPRPRYLFMCRKGFTAFDSGEDSFKGGGWWLFEESGEYVRNTNGEPVTGAWDGTRGDLPLHLLYYDRDVGSDNVPAISRPGLQGLGQVAVSYMNLASAADFDAWDAGQSIIFLMGLNPADHQKVLDQYLGGSKMVGVPLTMDQAGNVHMPSIQDGSTGAVSADVFDKRLESKWRQAQVLAALESTGNPNTSGASKQASFADIMSPRLATHAANLESSQNAAIHMLEARFSGGRKRPSGSVAWPREFNLKDVVQDISTMFTMERTAGATNPEFNAELLVRAAEELGLLTDPEKKERYLTAYRDALQQGADQAAQAQALAALMGAQ